MFSSSYLNVFNTITNVCFGHHSILSGFKHQTVIRQLSKGNIQQYLGIKYTEQGILSNNSLQHVLQLFQTKT